MFIIISITINLPRQLAFEASPCQTGATAVNANHFLWILQLTCRCVDTVSYTGNDPVARSVTGFMEQPGSTHLPTIISGTPNEAIWIIAPMLMIVVPRSTHFFLPSGSPIAQTETAPRKHPMS